MVNDTFSIYFKKIITNDLVLPTELEYELLINKIKDENPFIIAIRIPSTGLNSIFVEMIERLNKLNIPVIVGGASPTIVPEFFLDKVDYVCLGEGEYTILELLDKLVNNKSINDIKGLLTKGQDINALKKRELTDISLLPIPFIKNYCHIENNKLSKLDNEIYTTLTSRGCPFQCTYCSNSFFHNLYKGCDLKWLRKRNVDNVIEELKIAKKNLNFKYIDFHDDDFFYDTKWYFDFMKEYKKEIDMPFDAMTTFNYCDEKKLRVFKDCKGRKLKIGIQSGSERIRKEIFNRYGYGNQSIIEFTKLTNRLNIKPIFDVILDNPYEKLEDKEDNLKLMLNMKKPFELRMFSLIYYPKTKMTEMALKDGHISIDDTDDKKKKVTNHLRTRLTEKRSKEDMYYFGMYYLADSPLPRIIIKLIHKLGFLKRIPKVLLISRYLRMLNYIPKPSKYVYYFKKLVTKGVRSF